MSEMLACLIQVLGDNYDIHSDHINAQTAHTVTHTDIHKRDIYNVSLRLADLRNMSSTFVARNAQVMLCHGPGNVPQFQITVPLQV